MSNEKEKLARQWAESVRDSDPIMSERAHAAAEHILATTSPLTMADVQWNTEAHRGAGVTADTGSEWVMLRSNGGKRIECVRTDMKEYLSLSRSDITPNGKKYELVEVTGDEHPETLTTVEDYENAPVGTIVDIYGLVAVRGKRDWFPTDGTIIYSANEMFHQGEGDVIRWGWGK